MLGKILFKTCWFRMELLFFDLHRAGASLILHKDGLCRALLGQAAWQSAAASLVGLDQGVHWQSVVFHHPGADHHDESRRNPHLYKLDYLYPALTVACEGSWSLVRSHRDSKKWENCLVYELESDYTNTIMHGSPFFRTFPTWLQL